jgi:hypothetical protein
MVTCVSDVKISGHIDCEALRVFELPGTAAVVAKSI